MHGVALQQALAETTEAKGIVSMGNRRIIIALAVLTLYFFKNSLAIAEEQRSTSALSNFAKRAAEDRRRNRQTMAAFGEQAAFMELQHRQNLELQQKQFDHEKEMQYQKTISDQQDFFAHHSRCMGALVKRHPEMFDDEGGYLPDTLKGRIWERVATEHPEYAKQVGGVCMAMEEMERILRDEK